MRPSPSSPLSRTPPSTHPSPRRERGEAGVRGQGRQTGRDVPPHGGRRPRTSARRGVRTSRSLGDGAVPSTGPLRSPLRSTPMRAGCGCWNVRRRATALPTLSRPTHRREQDRRRRPNPPRRRRRSRPKPRGDGRADPSREATEESTWAKEPVFEPPPRPRDLACESGGRTRDIPQRRVQPVLFRASWSRLRGPAWAHMFHVERGRLARLEAWPPARVVHLRPSLSLGPSSTFARQETIGSDRHITPVASSEQVRAAPRQHGSCHPTGAASGVAREALESAVTPPGATTPRHPGQP